VIFNIKKLFKSFFFIKYFGCHENQMSSRNLFIFITLVGLHARKIPAKFQQIWPSDLGADIFKEIVDARTHGRTMDDGQCTIRKAHLEDIVHR
jgi:hypothetical protein